MGKLSGRRAVVTGAAAGLGRAIARLFAEEGAEVAILDRNEAGAAETARLIEAQGGRALALRADVGEEAEVRVVFARVREALGDPEILVNNAGVAGVRRLDEMSSEDWDRMIRVDLTSVFLCCREVLPAMRARCWGRIVNIGSQIAHRGAEGMTHYAAAKAGVLGLTRSLAREVVADGIAVNAICPGPLDTDMKLPPDWVARNRRDLPIGREGRVEEIAPTALLLASEEAAFYVGASFNPNGGDVMI